MDCRTQRFLSGFFGLLALWAYVVYAQQRSARWYWFSLGTFALGLLCKPMLVTLPLIMLLLDIWPLRGEGSHASGSVEPTLRPGGATGRKRARRALAPPRFRSALLMEKLPFFVLAAVSCAITLVVQRSGGSISSVLLLRSRVANAFVAVLGYLEKFIWPNDLAVLYPHPGFWPVTTVVASILLFVLVTTAALSQFRDRPSLAIG